MHAPTPPHLGVGQGFCYLVCSSQPSATLQGRERYPALSRAFQVLIAISDTGVAMLSSRRSASPPPVSVRLSSMMEDLVLLELLT